RHLRLPLCSKTLLAGQVESFGRRHKLRVISSFSTPKIPCNFRCGSRGEWILYRIAISDDRRAASAHAQSTSTRYRRHVVTTEISAKRWMFLRKSAATRPSKL